METEQAFGMALRKFRNQKGVSQEKLAAICGLDRTTVSLMERGRRNPSLKSILLLAKGLGVAPHHIMEEVHRLDPRIDLPE